jgi:hypothetical protein
LLTVQYWGGEANPAAVAYIEGECSANLKILRTDDVNPIAVAVENWIWNHALPRSLVERPAPSYVRRSCKLVILNKLVALTGLEQVNGQPWQAELGLSGCKYVRLVLVAPP